MIHEFVSALVDLALPRPCLGCRGAGGPLCGECRPAGAGPVAAGLPMPVAAAGAYDAVLRTAVLAYKERGRRDLAGPLGALLADAVSAALTVAPVTSTRHVLLVPVPSSAAARAARGGDHVRRLARRAAPRCGLRVAAALELTRVPRDSAGLGVEERAANLDGAMRAAAAPAGGVAVIVDDVVTTGATLREARRALLASGWSVAAAAAVAATARRHPPRPGAAGDLEPLAAHSGPD